MPQVVIDLDNAENKLFEVYQHEIDFEEKEFIELTKKNKLKIAIQQDVYYFQR